MQSIFSKQYKLLTCHLLFLFLLLAFNSCISQGSKNYFEGRVTYKIVINSLSNNVDLNQLKSIFGDTMIYTFKNGFVKKEYYSNKALISTRIFNPMENLNSKIDSYVDTIYQYHPSKSEFPLKDYIHLKDSIINSKVMKGVKVVILDTSSSFNIEYTYYFDNSLKINPDWFEEFKEGDWNRITKEMKSISNYYTIQLTPDFIVTYKAEKIESELIQDNEFLLPKYFIKNID